MPLPVKRQRFVEEYVVDFNGSQAAIRAGYSARTAGAAASRLLKDVKISVAIAKRIKKMTERADIDAQWALDRVIENIQRGLQKEPVLNSQGEPTGEWRYEGNVVNRALELLYKYHLQIAEKHEQTGKDGGPVLVQVVSNQAKDLTERIAQGERTEQDV